MNGQIFPNICKWNLMQSQCVCVCVVQLFKVDASSFLRDIIKRFIVHDTTKRLGCMRVSEYRYSAHSPVHNNVHFHIFLRMGSTMSRHTSGSNC